MKRQIRFGVFETNSSSTHSLSMCTQQEFNDWSSGKLLFNENWGIKKQFVTETEALNYLKEKGYLYEGCDEAEILREYEFYTKDAYFDDEYLEGFDNTYTTPGGEVVVAFGKYGND